MADSEKAPEQQQQAPAKAEGTKNDSAATPPATEEQQQPKQIIGECVTQDKKKQTQNEKNSQNPKRNERQISEIHSEPGIRMKKEPNAPQKTKNIEMTLIFFLPKKKPETKNQCEIRNVLLFGLSV